MIGGSTHATGVAELDQPAAPLEAGGCATAYTITTRGSTSPVTGSDSGEFGPEDDQDADHGQGRPQASSPSMARSSASVLVDQIAQGRVIMGGPDSDICITQKFRDLIGLGAVVHDLGDPPSARGLFERALLSLRWSGPNHAHVRTMSRATLDGSCGTRVILPGTGIL